MISEFLRIKLRANMQADTINIAKLESWYIAGQCSIITQGIFGCYSIRVSFCMNSSIGLLCISGSRLSNLPLINVLQKTVTAIMIAIGVALGAGMKKVHIITGDTRGITNLKNLMWSKDISHLKCLLY